LEDIRFSRKKNLVEKEKARGGNTPGTVFYGQECTAMIIELSREK
jgi:hypothetical protein